MSALWRLGLVAFLLLFVVLIAMAVLAVRS
jgi:hypothetical protein